MRGKIGYEEMRVIIAIQNNNRATKIYWSVGSVGVFTKGSSKEELRGAVLPRPESHVQ